MISVLSWCIGFPQFLIKVSYFSCEYYYKYFHANFLMCFTFWNPYFRNLNVVLRDILHPKLLNVTILRDIFFLSHFSIVEHFCVFDFQ